MWEQLSLDAALHIAKNMKQAHRQCLAITMGEISDEVFALHRWQSNGAAWTFYQDGEPVFMGGIEQNVPWQGTAWMVTTGHIRPESWKKIIRFSRTVFKNASRQIQRIDAHVLEGWPEAQKYAEKIGFKLVNVREKACLGGQGIYEYAIIGAIE